MQMDEHYDMSDNHLEHSQGTGILIPQAQIMDVLHNLNVSFPYHYPKIYEVKIFTRLFYIR